MRTRLLGAALAMAIGGLIQAACGGASLSTTAPDAPKCQVTVDNAVPSAPAGGMSGTVTVTTTRDCTWAAASDSSWITITSSHSGQGSGTVAYRVDANAQPSPRHGAIDVNGSPVTVSQDAAPCKFTVSPLNASVSASANSVTLSVQAMTGCKWTADTDQPWLHVTAGASGDGNGSVRATVDENSGAARTAHARIADQTVTIQQAEMTPPTPTPPPPSPTPTPPAPPPPTACHFTLSATTQSVSPSGGTGSVEVGTDSGCAWTATSNASWISITRGASGTGEGSVSYTAAANSGAARTGTLTIAGQTVTITQAATPPPACSYAISPGSQSVDPTGGGGSIAVTAGSGCAWSAASNASWITISSGASGSGNGSVTFSVAANSGAARTGTLTIGGQTFTVSQAAAPPPACSYSIAPASQSVDSTGGSGSTAVTTTTGCAWTATSNAPWITISSGASGSGSGSVSFSIASNTDGARTGTLTIGGQTFTVSQAAAPPVCSYSIAPANQSVDSTGGSGSTMVTTTSGCAWTATSNAPWITVSSGASGSGSGSVSFSIASNNGAARSGTLTIAGQTFTVSQAAVPPPPCTYTISPTSASVPAGGITGPVTITTGPTCTWTATSNVDWMSVNGAASGTGSGSVSITVSANRTHAPRSGTATIAGQTLTVTQAAGS